MKAKQVTQAEVNIGVVGHVDHGKTSIVKALTEEWADRHSEEIMRGITIRLGYADANFYYCDKCKEDEKYSTKDKCEDGHAAKFLRKVSFVDCPGHEALMAVMLSGASLMDGAMLVIAANEPCPQPQTVEHLSALNISGIKNIVIVQNKIDLVSKEEAKKHMQEIKNFVKGSIAENAKIIPVAAHYNININSVIKEIQECIPTPTRDVKKDFRMFIARSFDINKPGSDVSKINGGVIGGAILQGVLKLGDEIEIVPGVLNEKGEKGYKSIVTKVASLSVKEGSLEKAHPGGLVGVGTFIDPSLTKVDSMIGSVVGKPGTLPPVRNELKLSLHLFDHVVELEKVENLKTGESLVINAGTTTVLGVVTECKRDKAKINLKRPICVDEGQNVSISRKSITRWCLIGYGVVE